MIQIEIPGYKMLQIRHLVLDYNGTIAIDGKLIKGVSDLLNNLSKRVSVHILTADTFGRARAETKHLNIDLEIIPQKDQLNKKQEFIKNVGSSYCVAIGNGMNDSFMLKEAELGIALIQEEGASTQAILNADVVCKNIFSALELLQCPNRLKATLRR